MKSLGKRVILSAVIFVAVFFLTSCSGGPASSVAASPNQPAQAPTLTPTPAPTNAPLAARVNDRGITLAALERQVERRLDGLRAIGEAVPTDLTAFRMTVLDSMIEQVLIEQAAAIQGITITDADVQQELDTTIQIAGSREAWLKQLENERLTEDDYRAGLREALITARMRDIVTANICNTVEQAHARHILVADQQTALQIKAQLDGGADFVALAAQFSLDVTTKQSGGDLGWFSRGQLLQPAVEEAAFSQAIGAVGTPIASELGYHIIQVLERAKDRPVEPEMCARLSEDAFERWILDLKSKAQIEKYL